MHSMEMPKHFLSAILCVAFAFSVLVHAQDQSGFISIDCGIPEGYVDKNTTINYLSDAGFIETGVNRNISSEIDATALEEQYKTVRSFPEGVKNCYSLKPEQGANNSYLIRVGFLYGNYDNKSDVPRFDLYLGVNYWDTVRLYDAYSNFYYETIHVPQTDNIQVCLVNTGFGTPFISVLELRLLNRTIYVPKSASLQLLSRMDCGLTTKDAIRFPDDIYDRIWTSFTYELWENVSASPTLQSLAQDQYKVPSDVMKTAVTQLNDSELRVGFGITRDDPTTQIYFQLHFAEIQVLQPTQLRAFDVYMNDDLLYEYFVPNSSRTITLYNRAPFNGTSFDFRLNKTDNSTLPPLLNAFEVFLARDFSQPETYQKDVDAILNIKSVYNVIKHWQGDPCLPEYAEWDGLNCSYSDLNPPRIISLNLSSSGLTGNITPSIADLKMLQYLDLSNNSLTGPVPDFLSNLPFLRVLNLEENDLWGLVPQELIERSKNGSLTLSVGGNRNICTSNLCKHKFIVPLVSTTGAVFGLLLIAFAIFWINKRRKTGSIIAHFGALNYKERQFAYSEVLHITNNLERVLGRGKSGIVYYGHLEGNHVAVKIFSSSCVQGYKQFQTDAKLITTVHHRYLTNSFGYFDEGNDKGLISEYMPNGSLEDILSGRNTNLLSWQERLQIAMDVAQGLDYLQNGCKPPIIHGNLKPTNILLNENYQAKLVDFGLSKLFKTEGAFSDYLDPECYVTNNLTERSDIYSFGVILLGIITNRNVVISNNNNRTQEKTHLTQWVSVMIGKGDIKNVVDQRLGGDFHVDSAWKAVEIAMACVSPISMKRPTVNQVVMELNQCLAMEITRINRAEGVIEMVTVNLSTSLLPQAR